MGTIKESIWTYATNNITKSERFRNQWVAGKDRFEAFEDIYIKWTGDADTKCKMMEMW